MAENKTENTEKKEEKVVVEIIRGRMPLPIVHAIKFGPADETDGALAAKFRTTNGKISDIRKERNFGYIKEDYVPSEEQLAKAKAYAEQLKDKSILKAISKVKPATAEQNAAFDALRKAERKGKEVEAVPIKTEAAEADSALDELTEE